MMEVELEWSWWLYHEVTWDPRAPSTTDLAPHPCAEQGWLQMPVPGMGGLWNATPALGTQSTSQDDQGMESSWEGYTFCSIKNWGTHMWRCREMSKMFQNPKALLLISSAHLQMRKPLSCVSQDTLSQTGLANNKQNTHGSQKTL